MDTIILAGGFGTRLSEYTHSIPKPMVQIGGEPILKHIIDIYVKHGQKNFFIAMGYKSEEIIKYFVGVEKYHDCKNDTIICVNDYNDNFSKEKININLIYTGKDTMTGGRVKRMQDLISSNEFMVTYGDGLANIDISKLISFHKSNNKIGTVTAVRPPARFGELEINGNIVSSFREKPQLQKGWINGGFFVFDKIFFEYISGDEIMLEREPLEKLTEVNQLMAYKHDLFWQCMDTKRDKDLLENMWKNKNAIWKS